MKWLIVVPWQQLILAHNPLIIQQALSPVRILSNPGIISNRGESPHINRFNEYVKGLLYSYLHYHDDQRKTVTGNSLLNPEGETASRAAQLMRIVGCGVP